MKKIVLLALAACGLLCAPHWARAQAFTGLQATGLGLSVFSAPGATPVSYVVNGTSGGEALVGIDYFASTAGPLYGMAASGNLYTLAQTGTTYTATLNNATGIAGVTVIDFNPVANRLRVYAGTANYRVTPGTGGLVTSDGTLTYNSGDVNFGTTPVLRGIAYTNNASGATSTSLYSIDTTLNTLVLNTGTPQFNGLTTVATLTLAGLTFDATPGNTGFDIAGTGIAYLSRGNELYTLNLGTGVLTNVGTQAGTGLIDIAFVPEPGTYALVGLGGAALVVFAVRRRPRHAA